MSKKNASVGPLTKNEHAMAMLMLSAAMVSVMLSCDVVSPLDSLSSVVPSTVRR